METKIALLGTQGESGGEDRGGTIARNASKRIKRLAKMATVEVVVAERVLSGGESYRTVAADLRVSVSTIHRAVDRLRGRHEDEAEQRFRVQAALLSQHRRPRWTCSGRPGR